jgi:dTDP-4-dehydrorhamnose 3,5-epimerase
MKAPLDLPDVKLLTPRRFSDARGYFQELWSTKGSPDGAAFVQDNLSFSKKNVLRGLHLQNPGSQAKLVMVLSGAIWDVAVDVRVGSPSFGRWTAAELSEDNGHQLYVPRGFAHGFVVLSDTAKVLYKCDAPYRPDAEITVRFDDPALGISWPKGELILTPRDRDADTLAACEAQGRLPRYGEAP